MYDNSLRGDIPYIHIKTREGWECYPKPGNNHILAFLMLHLSYFDIYTCKGELVKEAEKLKSKKNNKNLKNITVINNHATDRI